MHKDLQKARNDFINLLIEYRKVKGHNITVVFDGHKDGGFKETNVVQGGVRIIYTPIGLSADDTILRIVSEDRYHWIVVSDDRMVSKGVWAVGSVAISCGLFLDKVNRSLCSEVNHDFYMDTEQKLSKRQKAIKRALSHL